jgi:hypothetical protein
MLSIEEVISSTRLFMNLGATYRCVVAKKRLVTGEMIRGEVGERDGWEGTYRWGTTIEVV